MSLLKIAYRFGILSSVGAICLAIFTSEAQAIVLIADFNGPPTNMQAFGFGDPSNSYNLATSLPYTASYNGGSHVGAGTIGNSMRIATEGNGTSFIINGTGMGQSGRLIASSAAGDASALLVLDAGTGSGIGNKPSLVLNPNGTISSFLNINSAGLGGANMMLGGDIPRGIVFDGLSGGLTGNATMELVVFKNDYATSGLYAFLQVTAGDFGQLLANPYVPFTGFADSYAADHLTFVSSTGNSSDLVGIFQSVGAIALATNANGGSFNIGLNSLYSHTPEPTSLLIWSGFALAAAGWRCRRKSNSADQHVSPACA